MVILYMVLICMGAGLALGLLKWLFDVVANHNIKDHFAKRKRRYQMIFIVSVIIAAAVYMASTTPNDDDNGIVQTDTRGNPLDN